MASESDGFGYGPVGKLRPLAIRVSERHGPAEDSSIFHVQLAGWWWYIQGEQQMATPESNTCALQLAAWWGHGWTQLLAFERYTDAYGKGMSLAIPQPITTAAWRCGSGIQAGPAWAPVWHYPILYGCPAHLQVLIDRRVVVDG